MLPTLGLAQSPSTYPRGGWVGYRGSVDANVTAQSLPLHRIGNQFPSHPAPAYPLQWLSHHQPNYNKIWHTQILQTCMKHSVNFKFFHIFTYYSAHLRILTFNVQVVLPHTDWTSRPCSSIIWSKEVLLTVHQLTPLLREAPLYCSNAYCQFSISLY
jgi:hypothetical protein